MALYPSIGTLPLSSTPLDSQHVTKSAGFRTMDEWINAELPYHHRCFTHKRELTVALMTFNVGTMSPGQGIDQCIRRELIPFPKNGEEFTVKSTSVSDIIVVALQEVDMSPGAILREQTNAMKEWTQYVSAALHMDAPFGGHIAENRQRMSQPTDTPSAPIQTQSEHESNSQAPCTPAYTMVISRQLVGILLLVYVHSHTVLPHMDELALQTVGTGAFGSMGNKGAIGMRMRLYGSTTLCILNMHLFAHMGEYERRNRDACTILGTFGQRRTRSLSQARRSSLPSGLPLLATEHDHCIVLGDLNYRIELPYEVAVKHAVNHHLEPLFRHDQLLRELRKNRPPWIGFSEGPITFPPTFKFDVGVRFQYDTGGKRRVPAFTDRVLWHSNEEESYQPHLCRYEPLMDVIASDHKPVIAVFRIPVRVLNTGKLLQVQRELLQLVTQIGLEQIAIPRLQLSVEKRTPLEANSSTYSGSLTSFTVPGIRVSQQGATDNCLNPSQLDFGEISALDDTWSSHHLRLHNTGHCVALIRVRRLLQSLSSSANLKDNGSWIRIQPEYFQILPSASAEIQLEAVVDRFTSHQLLSHGRPFERKPLLELSVMLGFEMKGGGVRFLQCTAKLKWTLLGVPIQTLLDCRGLACEEAFAEGPNELLKREGPCIRQAIPSTTNKDEIDTQFPTIYVIPSVLRRLCRSFVITQQQLSTEQVSENTYSSSENVGDLFHKLWDPELTPLALRDDVLALLRRLSCESTPNISVSLQTIQMEGDPMPLLRSRLAIVRAALLQWLQELPEPVIPTTLTPAALALGKQALIADHIPPPAALHTWVSAIPVSNRNVLLYLLGFLRFLLRHSPQLAPWVLSNEFTGVLFGTSAETTSAIDRRSPSEKWFRQQPVSSTEPTTGLPRQQRALSEVFKPSDIALNSASQADGFVDMTQQRYHYKIASAWRQHNERHNAKMQALAEVVLALLGNEWLEG